MTKSNTILVVGGAGYIGSHMVKRLLQAGREVIVLDNFSTGHRDAVVGGRLVEGDLGDAVLLDELFRGHRVEAVMHFAALLRVDESVVHPERYYANNVTRTLALLDAMVRHNVKRFVFSSSCAVFGEPAVDVIDESLPLNPITPYGETKRIVEQALDFYERAHGMRAMSLRYFNAAGADPEGQLGERHEPETHLIPLVLRAASGRLAAVSIYGDDYDTPDGTCLRDYVHVTDLCDAHLLALDKLDAGATTAQYNLGSGTGFSVREIIAAAEQVTGTTIATRVAPRRPGDPPRLVADNRRARAELRWQPRYPDLESIIGHAWAWEQRLAAAA
jgi:UDP-glucose 4-epimerase